MAEKYLTSVMTHAGKLRIPAWIADHRLFLKWLRSGELPEEARVQYIKGEVWVDPMPERAYAHNQIKPVVASVLHPLIRSQKLGAYFGDGMTFTSEAEGFTTVPDGIFVSREAMGSGRVRLTGGQRGHRDTELVGVPDIIVEVVNDSSADDDTAWLNAKYWDAGIAEFWVIDARSTPLRFTIFRHAARGYVAARKSNGWLKSGVFGRFFRFVPGEKQFGHATYDFEVR